MQSDSKKTALAILNMFDPGVTHLVEGIEIDRPRNAISLTLEFHIQFGNFDAYFEPAQPPDTHPPQTHAVLTKILHASGMAEYIEDVLSDRAEIECLAGNGSTDLEGLFLVSRAV